MRYLDSLGSGVGGRLFLRELKDVFQLLVQDRIIEPELHLYNGGNPNNNKKKVRNECRESGLARRSAGLTTFWLHDLLLHLLSQLFLGVDEGQCGRAVSVVFGKRPRLAAVEGQQVVTTLSPFRLLVRTD